MKWSTVQSNARQSLVLAIGIWSLVNWLWLLIVFFGLYCDIQQMFEEMMAGYMWFIWYNAIWLLPGACVLFLVTLIIRLALHPTGHKGANYGNTRPPTP